MPNKRVRVEQAIVARRIVQKYASSLRGHDNCHWHPELWGELMRLFGVEYPPDRELPPRSQFRERCLRYEDELYEGRERN